MAKIHMKNQNNKKWPKYNTRVIYGLSIFFFRKVNHTIMRKFAILLIENVFNQFFKRVNFFFHTRVLGEVIQMDT